MNKFLNLIKDHIIVIIILTIVCTYAIYNAKPKPETQFAEIIGKSFQNSPENWDIISEQSLLCSIYQIHHKKCDLIINLYPNFVINSEFLDGSCIVKFNKNNTELSKKDFTYISYQFDNYILSVRLKQQEEQSQKEFQQKQYLEKIKRDSLINIRYNELKQNTCL